MTKYYSLESDWTNLKNEVGSFTAGRFSYNIWSEITELFATIDETERLIEYYELGYLYEKTDKYYSVDVVTRVSSLFSNTYDVLEQNIHKKTLASIDSKACDLGTRAISLLNQVNSGKNIYESQHITTKEVVSGTRGMNDYGTTKNITRPMTADELMKLDYAPLNKVRDDFKERLEKYQNDALQNEQLSIEQIDALKNMTIQDVMGYTGDFGEYIMVLSDRAQRWSINEPLLDIAISLLGVLLAVPTGGASLALVGVYYTTKCVWYLSNGTNMLTGMPLTNDDKAWLVFDSVTSLLTASAGLKLLKSGSKVPSTLTKVLKASDKCANVVELSIAAIAGAGAIDNEQYGSGILLFGLVLLGANGVNKSSGIDDVTKEVKVSFKKSSYLDNLNDFLDGRKFFDDVLDDYAEAYSNCINNN